MVLKKILSERDRKTQKKYIKYIFIVIGVLIILYVLAIYTWNSQLTQLTSFLGNLTKSTQSTTWVPNPNEINNIIARKKLETIDPVLTTIVGLESRNLLSVVCVRKDGAPKFTQVIETDLKNPNSANGETKPITNIRNSDLKYGEIICFTPAYFKLALQNNNSESFKDAKLLSEGFVPLDPKLKSDTFKFIDRVNEVLSQSGSLESLKKEADDLTKRDNPSFKEKIYLLSVLGDQKITQNFLNTSCKTDKEICLPWNIVVEGKILNPNKTAEQSIRVISGSGQTSLGEDGWFILKFKAPAYTRQAIGLYEGDILKETRYIDIVWSGNSQFKLFFNEK